MNEAQMFTAALGVIGGLLSLLALMVGWFGARAYNKLDEMGKTMHELVGSLHERITGIDRRVVAVETKCEANHTLYQGRREY